MSSQTPQPDRAHDDSWLKRHQTDWRQMTLPGMEVTVPEAAVVNAMALQRAVEEIAMASTRLANALGDAGGMMGTMVQTGSEHLRIQKNVTKAITEEKLQRQQTYKFQQDAMKAAREAEAIQARQVALEKESSRLMEVRAGAFGRIKDRSSEILSLMRKGGAVDKEGRIELYGKQGQVVDKISPQELQKIITEGTAKQRANLQMQIESILSRQESVPEQQQPTGGKVAISNVPYFQRKRMAVGIEHGVFDSNLLGGGLLAIDRERAANMELRRGVQGIRGVRSILAGFTNPRQAMESLTALIPFGEAAFFLREGLPLMEHVVTALPQRINQYRALGQITGTPGGYFSQVGAGIGMRAEAFRLGINPFDMISGAMAREIVQGTAERGFQGQQLNTVASGIAGVVNQLGIQIPQALDILTESIRRGGLTVKETTDAMKTFDDQAHNMHLSVQEYTDAFQNLQTMFIQGGAGKSSIPVSQTILRALPEALQRDPQGTTQMMQQMMPYLAGRMGVLPQMLQLPEYAQRIPAAMGQLIDPMIRHAMDTFDGNIGRAAVQLSVAGPLSGLPVQTIEELIKQERSGRGFAAQASAQHRIRQYLIDRNRLRTVHPMTLRQIQQRYGDTAVMRLLEHSRMWGQLTPGQQIQVRTLKDYQRNIEDVLMDRTSTGLIGPHARPQWLEHRFPVLENLHDLNQRQFGQVVALRQQLVKSLGPFLDSNQRNYIESHLKDRSFQIDKYIQNAMSQPHAISSNSVNVGGITIRLDNNASKYFKISPDQYAKHGNANQMPPGTSH